MKVKEPKSIQIYKMGRVRAAYFESDARRSSDASRRRTSGLSGQPQLRFALEYCRAHFFDGINSLRKCIDRMLLFQASKKNPKSKQKAEDLVYRYTEKPLGT